MQNLPSAPVDRQTLLNWLSTNDIAVETFDHPAFFTVEEGAAFKAGLTAQGITGGNTKNLFLKDKKGRHFLLTAQEDTDIDLKRIHRLLGGQGRVSFGRAEQMEAWLSVSPGSVTAFGILNDRDNNVTFAIDARLLENDHIFCHPMTNEATIRIGREDLLTVARHAGHDPLIVDLSATPD